METIKDVVKDYTVGKGKYKSTKDQKAYDCWNSMIRRCKLSNTYNYKNWNTYKDIEICDEWMNFQTFAEFYYDNIYSVPTGERVEIDKDILQHDGRKIKIYSPKTCLFVPHSINSALTNNRKLRGEYPIGVSFYCGKYWGECVSVGHEKAKKSFNNPNSAFKFYKRMKEKYIRELAEYYKNWIPEKLYNALMSYEIREDD
ncbi:hypothetical protein NIE88_12680 [Sporolactobacillus shoreicorticis]|uniref:AP2 domain-containing protein n=1 Tax=Sporolactobacillus shoreicorticis TaxID=1923877 RepID=A0ABW5S9F5_9BACL|nr:hypothetical protein [Sporolactobacillus shoreicorticis]MCO7126620.1 hypothetical protein [Sporolactobacillus shoreicorticis]